MKVNIRRGMPDREPENLEPTCVNILTSTQPKWKEKAICSDVKVNTGGERGGGDARQRISSISMYYLPLLPPPVQIASLLHTSIPSSTPLPHPHILSHSSTTPLFSPTPPPTQISPTLPPTYAHTPPFPTPPPTQIFPTLPPTYTLPPPPSPNYKPVCN